MRYKLMLSIVEPLHGPGDPYKVWAEAMVGGGDNFTAVDVAFVALAEREQAAIEYRHKSGKP
jgi:hypothetical protein